MDEFNSKIKAWIKLFDSNILLKVGYSIFGGFVLASFSGTVIMTIFLESPHIKLERGSSGKAFIKLSSEVDYHNIKKTITGRNLFNSAGTLPEEVDDEAFVEEKSKFDMNGPCSASALKIELVGTIYGGEGGISVATVRESGINFADVYRVGDEIVDSGGATVVKIEPKQIILNNNGKKECITTKETQKVLHGGSDVSDEEAFAAELEKDSQQQNQAGASTTASTVILDAAFVEKELGPGFTQIMQTVRVVPNIVDGTMNGFKVFAIKPGSLFSKIFSEGDVVTQVNDSNLSQPEQGFSVYQAFLDSQDIRINILRGNEKATINVQIK